jgi:mannose-6-phosphate isomerase-like protein (cupin superfamily)
VIGSLRSQTLLGAPGATVAIQTGDAPKHFHQDSVEVQYVVEGSGKFWLGDTQRDVGPGDLIIIPKGTPHGGSVATSGRFKVLAIKAPPQGQGDLHVVQ